MRVSADSDSPWPSQEYGSWKPDRPYPSGLSPQHTRDYFIRHSIMELEGPKSLLKWIRDFLSGRNQRVLVDGKSTNNTPVQSDVPQGSVLGPLIFLPSLHLWHPGISPPLQCAEGWSCSCRSSGPYSRQNVSSW